MVKDAYFDRMRLSCGEIHPTFRKTDPAFTVLI